jgi:hypothetical protein
LFDTVRIWEFSPVWTDFDKFDNLSKRNVKVILKIFTDLEPLRGSSNKKTLYSTRSSVIWAFFGTREPLKLSLHSSFKLAHSCREKPKLHTNSLNKLLFCYPRPLSLRNSPIPIETKIIKLIQHLQPEIYPHLIISKIRKTVNWFFRC